MKQIKNAIRKMIPQKIKEFVAYHPANSFGKLTFSQEGEDVLLNRIFYNIEDGFFVDVGANHPYRFSNTYRLYTRGWSGINIEPNPELIKIFQNERKRDINIQIGISMKSDELEYFYYQNSTLNTFDKKLVTERSIKPYKSEIIHVDSLANILNQYLPQEKEIDFLNIDAEGFDLVVLQSNDWDKYRVKYICIETKEIMVIDLLNSDLNRFLNSKGYILISKLFKSVLYKKQE